MISGVRALQPCRILLPCSEVAVGTNINGDRDCNSTVSSIDVMEPNDWEVRSISRN